MDRKVSFNKMVNVWMSGWEWENISLEYHEKMADEYTRGKISKSKEIFQAPEGHKAKNI